MANTWLQNTPLWTRYLFLTVLLLLAVLASYLLKHGPIAQDPAYHAFADQNAMLGVPNLWNVASNLGFLYVGLLGLYNLARKAHTTQLQGLNANYWVFFCGLILVSLGSSYYHWMPSNQGLLWDRLPMGISFMAIFSLVLGEKLNVRIGQRSLIPLVFMGVCSVLYWYYTELQGMGDLRFYAFVQFIPLLMVPILLITSSKQTSANRYWWLLVLFYALSKITEFLDIEIYQATGFISGHSIKHLLAAYATYWVLRRMQSLINPAI